MCARVEAREEMYCSQRVLGAPAIKTNNSDTATV